MAEGKKGYIAALLQPLKNTQGDRRVWSIPLNGVWIPFFTATNVAGETAIPVEALGAPVRLQREQDGTPKLNKTGKPVVRVVKELSDQVRIVRENFAYGLLAYAKGVMETMPEEYKAQVEASAKAGNPIVQKDSADLRDFLMAKAAKSEAPAQDTTIHAPEKELVPA